MGSETRRTGEPRWEAVWRQLADAVWEGWVQDEQRGYRIWTQHLYNHVAQCVGPVHGMAGCVAVLAARPDLLGAECAAELELDAVRTVTATSVVQDGRATWEPIAGNGLAVRGPSEIPMQWCHGAPGMVATLAGIAPHDDAFTRLLVASGELTWEAGPLRKGRRSATARPATASRSWHCSSAPATSAGSSGRAASPCTPPTRSSSPGPPMAADHSLWTGDPGVALYLRSCIDPASPVGIDIGCW